VDVREDVRVGEQRADYAASVVLGRQVLELLIELKSAGSGARLSEAIEVLRSRQERWPDRHWVLAAPFLSPSRIPQPVC